MALRFVEDVPAEETGQPPEADLGQSNAMVKSQNGRLPPSTWDLAEIGSPGSFGAVVLRRFGFYMQTNPTFLPASLGKE